MSAQLQTDAAEPEDAIRAFNNWYSTICAHPVMGDFYLVTDNAAFDIAFINFYLAVQLAAPPLTNRSARSDGMSQDSSASEEEPRSFIPPVDVRSLVCGLPTSLLTAGRARRHQFLPAPWGSAKALCRNVLAKACPGAKTHMPDDDAFIIGWHFGQLLSYLGEQAAALQSHLSHAAALGVTGNDMAMPGTFLHYALGLQHLKHGSATGAASARVPGGVSMATTVTFSPPGQRLTEAPAAGNRRKVYSEDPHASPLGVSTPPFMPMSPPPSATHIDLDSAHVAMTPPAVATAGVNEHTRSSMAAPSLAAASALGAGDEDFRAEAEHSYVMDAQSRDSSVATKQVPISPAASSRKNRSAEGWDDKAASAAKGALVTPVAHVTPGDDGSQEAPVPTELLPQAAGAAATLVGHKAAVSAGNPLGLLPPVGEFLVPSLQSVHNMAKLTFKYNQGHYGKPGGGWIKCFPVDALVHDLMAEHGPTWAVSGFHPLRIRRKRGAEGREYESMAVAHDGTEVPRIMIDRLCGVLMEAYAMAVTFCRGGPSHSHCSLPYPAQDSAMWFHPASGSAQGNGRSRGGGASGSHPPHRRHEQFPNQLLPLGSPASALHSLPEGDSLLVQSASMPTASMQYRPPPASSTAAEQAPPAPKPPASPEWRSTSAKAAPPQQALGGSALSMEGGGSVGTGGFTLAGAMQKMGWSMQGMAALASMNPSVWGGGMPSKDGAGGGQVTHAGESGSAGHFGLVPGEAFNNRRRGAGGHRGGHQRRRPRSQSEDGIALHGSNQMPSTPSRGYARGRGSRRGGRGDSTASPGADGKPRRR